MFLTLTELLLLVIAILMAVIAVNTMPEPTRGHVFTGMKYITVVLACLAGFSLIFFMLISTKV